MSALNAPLVLKVGGELLEDEERLQTLVRAVARVTAAQPRLVVVHGGGKEIDAALATSGIEKRQVDGLRITDAATLDVVVGVLAGRINTRVVAALYAAGVPAVGLTGADGGCGLAERAAVHRTVDRRTVDLGLVGVPTGAADARVLESLLRDRFVPVVASIGVDSRGQLLNVNADTMAGHVAGRLRARRLVIAGATAGVLGPDGATMPLLDPAAIGAVVDSGTATAGMVAKLRACEQALAAGVEDVVIVDGRDGEALVAAALGATPYPATRVVTTVETKR